jgi:toxin FitB
MIILDTNMVSELMKAEDKRDARFMGWLETVDGQDCYVTAIAVGEVLFGINILPNGMRKTRFLAEFEGLLSNAFRNRVLDYTAAAAVRFAQIAAARATSGHHIHADDLRIAAIASSAGMAGATRSTGDFYGSDVALINPWSGPSA